MPKFRKKPVVIEAWRFETNNDDGTHIRALVRQINSKGVADVATHDDTSVFIHTLEGVMRADVGDWIIQGVQGEFYPCKADIFAATYAPAKSGESVTAYVSIGNTDGKLSHAEWAEFHKLTGDLLTEVYGAWHSLPATPYVNACWAVEIPGQHLDAVKEALRALAARFRQDSIAFAIAETEFLSPA